MPRAQQSPIGRVLEFFRTASLETMNLAHELVRDTVNERNKKSNDAKKRATTGPRKGAPAAPAPAATTTPAPAGKKAKGAKKKAAGKKKQARGPRPGQRRIPAVPAAPDPHDQGEGFEEYAGPEGADETEDGQGVGATE